MLCQAFKKKSIFIFHFYLLLPYIPFTYILWFLILGFYGTPECVNECDSVSVSFACAFPQTLFLLSAVLLEFVLFFYFIMLYYYLDDCF